MRNESLQFDVTVIGGGLAGLCAAIAAARLGSKVALVHNRSVLGGNSSSEVRVWVCGATAHGTNRYARETGIMGELFVENQYRNKEGNPYIWDLVLMEAVRAEANISLFLNTDVHEVDAEGGEDNRNIKSVTGWMMGSERRIQFHSPMFLDCTGDGLVGFLAGARHRIGREAKSEYQEDWAPETADNITLGSTLLFYTKDTGQPVKYIAPSFAKDIQSTSIPLKRVIRSGDNGCAYWWIEWGGEHDIVHDNEAIRDELWAVIYGIWDYIKNSGQFDSETMTLEWVGSVPGKREYRRFLGDYVLNQQDILAQTPFEDRVAFGGWSIDLHPPQGVYSQQSGSKHLFADGIYHIPFRSLYSSNVNNLMFAGRNISASHVAFGTTRVMATCAVIGEAAGTGAALCLRQGVSPRELHRNHLELLQQTLLRQDASLIGVVNRDPHDLARAARISASSFLTQLNVENAGNVRNLNEDTGVLVPVDPGLDGMELLLTAAATVTLTVELWTTGKRENYVPHTQIDTYEVEVKQGPSQWVRIPLKWRPESPANAFIIIKANESVTLHSSVQPQTGIIVFEKGPQPIVSAELDVQPAQPVAQWRMHGQARSPLCIRLTAPTSAYSPDKAAGGYNRPYGGPQLWSSGTLTEAGEEWLELSWEHTQLIREIQLTFNDDVNEDLINLHHHFTPFEVIPELVKHYRVDIFGSDGWSTAVEVQDNHRRKRIHRLSSAVTAEKLRLVVLETNGCPRAEVTEIRVYGG
ncbi:FAD-dependent oxidoreductase [Paenibacillus nasutitermitis]|uniref:FAD-dependent oxidoreductase n=1 Tax=Paenibacillus nasutitermitis TaxID=1652958 RepID=A0A916Z019_9BACL|nr:FAD-dependent oxidoreductase [Paenibacillus nasutitermitis]GGD69739.1 hypothetical protein GCM10010911_29490 [Paenibacillus nasutitermitis]